MEGNLTHTINGVERKMFFGNYALEQTLVDLNISVTDVSLALERNFIGFFRVYIFHAAAYPLLKEGKEPDFTAFDIHDWIDQTGGVTSDFFVKVTKIVYASLGIAESDGKEQKKSTQKS